MSSKEIELAITAKVDAEDEKKCGKDCQNYHKLQCTEDRWFYYCNICYEGTKKVFELVDGLRCPTCLDAEQALKKEKQNDN